MKTILFIERDLADEREDLMPSFEAHAQLFEEIGEEFDVMVCPWYSQGETIETAVPDLYSMLKGVASWRGIVATDMSYGRGKHAGEKIVANPFDLYDLPPLEARFKLADDCLNDPLPVVRLSRMLGGIPKSYRTRSYEQGEEKPFEGAMMRYHLECTRPTELTFFSPRNTSSSVLMFDEGQVGVRDLFDGVDFSFVEKNGYADISRFIIMDRELPPSMQFDREMLAYWLFAFSYGMDSEGRSTLDIGQLYKARLELDEQEFFLAEAKRFAQFGVALDSIEEHVHSYRSERKHVSTKEEQELPAFQERVPDFYQFSKARDDREARPRAKATLVNQSARVTREPKRYIRRAIEDYREHKAPTVDEVATCLLSPNAQDELYDIVSDTELRLAMLDENCSLDTLRNQKKVEKLEPAITEHPTMSRAKAIKLAVMAFALVLISSISVPVGMVLNQTPGLTGKIILFACILVVSGVILGGTAIIFQYFSWRKNGIEISQIETEDEIGTPVSLRIAKASQRLSDYLTVRNGWMYYEHDVPETALIGEEECFLAEKYAMLNEITEPIFCNPKLRRMSEIERQNLPVMDWPHILKALRAGKFDGLQLHSADAFALFNTEVEGLSRWRVPLKSIKRVDLTSISPCIIKEVQ